MFVRAIVAFLACPTLFGGIVPAILAATDPDRGTPRAAGLALAAVGAAALLWCVRDFYAVGRGTLAPWAPPRRLVVVGLYRFVRNPMYLAVLALVAGIAWWRASPRTSVYALVLAYVFHLRVVLAEERALAAAFGTEWKTYSRAVRRWWPRLRPWHAPRRGAGELEDDARAGAPR
jgi:protein-S-isoprenylcysteine O-methyltransferase Ste14